VRTLPLTPPKGGSKSRFVVFVDKIRVQSNKVCYKVSLCEASGHIMYVTSLYVFVSVVLLSVFVCVLTVFNCVLCYGPSCLK